MEALVIGAYWFLNGVFLVIFTRGCLRIRKNTARWFLGFLLACLLCLGLFFGATIMFDHGLQTLRLQTLLGKGGFFI